MSTDEGDVIAHHVAETLEQFPVGCAVDPPRLTYHVPNGALFDELVRRLDLASTPGEGFAMSAPASRVHVYLFAPGCSTPPPVPTGRKRRR